jgi:DNA-binding transcriptional MerR regulator
MDDERFLIRDIARDAGVSVDTIRHYERKGVLGNVERDGSGYRRYTPDTMRRVQMVRRALTLGFTLDELASFFRQREAGRAPCKTVRALAARKLVEAEERIATLMSLRDNLARVIETWDSRLERTPQGGFAYLLESLL